MTSNASGPRSRRIPPWPVLAGALVVVVAVVFAGTYLVLFNGSSAPPLTLSTAVPSDSATHPAVVAGATESAGSTAASPGGIPSGAASAASAGGDASGAWTIGPNSVAGYRVREQLASLPAQSDAVGRTSQIAGTLQVGGSGQALTVAAAEFTVDVSTLKSDRAMRDNRIRSQGLESDRYPQATFKLTAPIALPANATSGSAIALSATGDLTIHGVTKSVTIPVQARWSAGTIEAAGSITFPFSDFGMTAPNIGGFVSVQDQATMEFDLHFVRA